MIDAISKMLGPLRTLVRNMVSRALVTSVDDSQKMQVVQIQLCDGEYSEIRTAERVQNYGFTGVPQNDAEAAVMFVGGRRDHGLVIAIDDRRYRITGLQNGEVAMYTDQGDSIVIKRGGTIRVTAATAIEFGGNSHAVALADKVLTEVNKLKTAFDAHVHAFTGTVAGAACSGTTAPGPSSAALSSPGSTLVKAGS